MQCCVSWAAINEVLKFLAPIPSETMHTIQIINPFSVTKPIITPLHLTRVGSYFDVRKPTLQEYEDQDILDRTHGGNSTMGSI